MMSASAPHITSLTGRRERESHQSSSSSSSSEHHLLNVSLLSYVLPYAADKIKSPFIFKSVCTSWAETVVHQGAGSNSWKVYFDFLRQEDPNYASVELMKLLKAFFGHIVKSSTDYWCLHCIFFACDKLQFRIDGGGSYHAYLTDLMFAARDSLIVNKELAKSANERDFRNSSLNFLMLFRGEILTNLLRETLYSSLSSGPKPKPGSPSSHRVKIAKIIVEHHYENASIEDVLAWPFLKGIRFNSVIICEFFPVWFGALKKVNKLDAARRQLLTPEDPFLCYVSSLLTADELQRLLSSLKTYFGDSFLRELFLEKSSWYSEQEGYHARMHACSVLSYALYYRSIDHFAVLVGAASSIGDEFFVDLCLKDDIRLLSFAYVLDREQQAEIIMSKIRSIKDPALVRRFVEGNQHLESGRGRESMNELLKKAGLIKE